MMNCWKKCMVKRKIAMNSYMTNGRRRTAANWQRQKKGFTDSDKEQEVVTYSSKIFWNILEQEQLIINSIVTSTVAVVFMLMLKLIFSTLFSIIFLTLVQYVSINTRRILWKSELKIIGRTFLIHCSILYFFVLRGRGGVEILKKGSYDHRYWNYTNINIILNSNYIYLCCTKQKFLFLKFTVGLVEKPNSFSQVISLFPSLTLRIF